MRGARVIGGPVTPTIVNIDIRNLPPTPEWQPGDPIKEIPRRLHPPKDIDPMSYEASPDPLVDLQAATTLRSTENFSTPILNQNGQGYSGVSPPDTVGDIGPNYYIQATNHSSGSSVQIYDKTGATVGPSFFMDTLGSGSCASGYGDPIILYDRQAERWFMQEFSSSGNYMCIYVSQTDDPVAGGWAAYGFQAPDFPDYPHFGVWSDAYYGTTNESSSAIYAFDRANMLLGLTARPMQRFTVPDLPGYSFEAATPADLDGPDAPPAGSPGIIMRHIDEEAHVSFPNNSTTDLLEIWAFTVDFDSASNSSLDQLPNVVITDFNSWFVNYTTFYSVPQPSGGGLDPIREVVLNRLQYRNFGTHESLVGVIPTNAYTATSGSDVSAALRWFELRRTIGDWQLHQEGTFATGDFDENRFVGSIAMDQSGNVAMGYSITDVGSPEIDPSLRYTGRLADDDAGVMTQTETQQVTGSGAGGGRWGDYASINLDPEDDCTFWFTSEFQDGSGWNTQITSFRFDACGCEIVVDAPTVGAAVTAPNEITVSWNDVPEPTVTEYLVYRSRTQGGPYQLIDTVADTSEDIGGGAGYLYADTDVSGGIDYYYVVRASDGSACRSDNSNEAMATATGACTLAPLFDGVASAANSATADCQIEVQWSAGTQECGSSLVYNVYRSETAGFTPDGSNMVASCIDAASILDTTAVSGITYHYIVRAEDNSGNGGGPCGGGNEDGNTAEASAAATGPDAIYFADDMESGDGNWTHSGIQDTWTLSDTRANSGSYSFYAEDLGTLSDQNLDSLEFALPAVPGITLEFWSWQEIEDSYSGNCFDGAIVEASTDGGSNWVQLPTSVMTTVPYDGTVDDGYSNPIADQEAWCGDPRDWELYVADLTAYAGQNVMLRFRLATDTSVSAEGWYIDDVRVITPSDCITNTGLFADDFENGDLSAWGRSVP